MAWTHDTCGSPVVFDLSGGFCTGCHAEGLDQDEITPQKPEAEAGG